MSILTCVRRMEDGRLSGSQNGMETWEGDPSNGRSALCPAMEQKYRDNNVADVASISEAVLLETWESRFLGTRYVSSQLTYLRSAKDYLRCSSDESERRQSI